MTRLRIAALTVLIALASTLALARAASLHVLRAGTTEIVLKVAPGGVHEGRYERAGARSWHRVALGHRRSWRVRGLRPATPYLFELRTCRQRRCGQWSAPLRATTAAATGTPAPQPGAPAGSVTCPIFPPDNPINQDVVQAAIDPNSAAYVQSIGAGLHLHPDFGSNPSYGIPFTVVGPSQPLVPITFTAYGGESNPGPYPVPLDAPVEQGSDAHVLTLQNGTCKLFEMFDAHRSGAGWAAGSGAVFDLRSNALRPDTWTSADAAGLPIMPLLVRYDEVASGHINHALRFTVQHSQRGFIHPATHFASSSSDPSLPPMGLRLRLKASFDISGYTGAAHVVLVALQHYGMYVADNGSNWFVSGATDARWNDTDLDQLKTVPGAAFEVVQSGPILH